MEDCLLCPETHPEVRPRFLLLVRRDVGVFVGEHTFQRDLLDLLVLVAQQLEARRIDVMKNTGFKQSFMY